MKLTTKEAVSFVLSFHELTKYRLAQMLGCAPPSIDQWLRTTKMSQAYADIFNTQFDVEITDAV